MKESIIKNITQVALIVFSVVLGLYLSEMLEERRNEKDATKLMLKIESELNANKVILDSWVPYHSEIVGNIDSLSMDEAFVDNFIKDRSTVYRAFTRGTIMSEAPSNDAWDIAKSHPLIVNFEFDELLILSRIYRQQEATYELVPKLVEVLMSRDLNSKENAEMNLQLIRNMMQDFSSREAMLMEYYDEAESILEYQNL